MYRERPSRVDGAVVWSWTATMVGAKRVLPDGCMDLIWGSGELLVAGADTHAHVFADHPEASFTGIRFAPGTGPAVLGVPAQELRDQRVPLAAIWPERTVRRLAEQVAAAPDWGGALETVALDRLAEVLPDPVCAMVAARLAHGGSVAGVARAVGLSERQLHRRCLAAFGYGPKTLAKVLRLQRALELARDGARLADVASNAGYADQSHLCLDVKALAGVPIRDLLAVPSRQTSGANSSTLLPSGSWIVA